MLAVVLAAIGIVSSVTLWHWSSWQFDRLIQRIRPIKTRRDKPMIVIHHGEREWKQWLEDCGLSETEAPFEHWLFVTTEYEPEIYDRAEEAQMHFEEWQERRAAAGRLELN